MPGTATASRPAKTRVCRCERCGHERTVSGRGRRARWCSDACRKAVERAADHWPDGIEQVEEALISTVRVRNRTPEMALLLFVFDTWAKAAA